MVEAVGPERRVLTRAVSDPDLARHYPTIYLVAKLGPGEKILSVSSCQNCRPEHYRKAAR